MNLKERVKADVSQMQRGLNLPSGSVTYTIKMVKSDPKRRRDAVMDLRRKGVCHFEIYGTGRIVKARKDCPHLVAQASI